MQLICETTHLPNGRKRFRVTEDGVLRITCGDLPTLVRCLGYLGRSLGDVQEIVL